jgi:hypothetical protein
MKEEEVLVAVILTRAHYGLVSWIQCYESSAFVTYGY